MLLSPEAILIDLSEPLFRRRPGYTELDCDLLNHFLLLRPGVAEEALLTAQFAIGCADSEFFIFFQSFLKDFPKRLLENCLGP